MFQSAKVNMIQLYCLFMDFFRHVW